MLTCPTAMRETSMSFLYAATVMAERREVGVVIVWNPQPHPPVRGERRVHEKGRGDYVCGDYRWL